MSEVRQMTLTLRELLEQHGRIEVPLIQRDYAQGRDLPQAQEVRENFLRALRQVIAQEPGAPRVLNLDFVYGSTEGGRFVPLDGQQRLTTLFLLHWYLAWRDGELKDFRGWARDENGKASFTYRVRQSSTEFFDGLVDCEPDCMPGDLKQEPGLAKKSPAPGGDSQRTGPLGRLLEDQPWFFLSWRLDPTVQAALRMLDAIHTFFGQTASGGYARLAGRSEGGAAGSAGVVTFHWLPLDHFKGPQADDLYLKMNARGLALTPYENFKARLEEALKKEESANALVAGAAEARHWGPQEMTLRSFLAQQMDTQWADFFWRHTPVGDMGKKSAYADTAALNLVWVVARVSVVGLSEKVSDAQEKKMEHMAANNPAASAVYFEDSAAVKLLAENLTCLLEVWSGGAEGRLNRLLPANGNSFFDESAFFQKMISRPGSTGVSYLELAQLAGYVMFLRRHAPVMQGDAVQEWMRVVRNLCVNSSITRAREFCQAMAGLEKLLPVSGAILQGLVQYREARPPGFDVVAWAEEILKARLLLAGEAAWRPLIARAEGHAYFRGQIGFLLDFAGVSEARQPCAPEEHADRQREMERYLTCAEMAFDEDGLKGGGRGEAGPRLWQRALLAVGDYLRERGSNYSFLTNATGDKASWKQFLRSGGEKREMLKALWDRLEIKTGQEVEPQLEEVITTALAEPPEGVRKLEFWEKAVLRHPEMISYCLQGEIQPHANDMYLLRGERVSGKHAEVTSYQLYLELRDADKAAAIQPLRARYESVSASYVEPYVALTLEAVEGISPSPPLEFKVDSKDQELYVRIELKALGKFLGLEERLRKLGFKDDGRDLWQKFWPVSHQALRDLAKDLREFLQVASAAMPGSGSPG